MNCSFCGRETPIVVHAFCTEGHCEDRNCIEACDSCQAWFMALGDPPTEEKKKEDGPKEQAKPTNGRPIYEKESDRIIQRDIITEFCKDDMTWEEMPPLHPWDFNVKVENYTIAIAEVKRRHIYASTFNKIIISKKKVDKCIEHARKEGIAFILVFKFNDYIGSIIVCDQNGVIIPMEQRFGGRYKEENDRNDPKDMEMLYCIPYKDFNPMVKQVL